MARIDWSILSGPRVSRRTLISLAIATGATGYAHRLAARSCSAPHDISDSPPLAQGDPKPGGTLKLGFGISQIPNLDPAKVNLGIVAGEICLEHVLQPRPVR